MSGTTESARARWVAEYREARKVRQFERRLMADSAPSSLSRTVRREAYIAAIESKLSVGLHYSRDRGRFGVSGTTKRHIPGPFRRLPA